LKCHYITNRDFIELASPLADFSPTVASFNDYGNSDISASSMRGQEYGIKVGGGVEASGRNKHGAARIAAPVNNKARHNCLPCASWLSRPGLKRCKSAGLDRPTIILNLTLAFPSNVSEHLLANLKRSGSWSGDS
jgi:hypothetical protein